MAVAVFWENCFFMITLTASQIKSHFTKSCRVSFEDLISAYRGSLCNFFTMSKPCLWRGQYQSYLHLFQTEWEVHYMFFQKSLRQVETRCLSIGFGAMEISFKSESLSSLSNSKRYNCLWCAYMATRLTPSSKISSPVLSVSHKLQIFFNRWT